MLVATGQLQVETATTLYDGPTAVLLRGVVPAHPANILTCTHADTCIPTEYKTHWQRRHTSGGTRHMLLLIEAFFLRVIKAVKTSRAVTE